MRGRIVVGIVFIVAGIAWILDLAGYPIFPGGFGTWWPLILILLGISQVVTTPWGRGGGVFLIALGVVLQLWRLGKLPGEWWAYVGATMIVFIGVSILTRPWRQKRWRERWGQRSNWQWQGPPQRYPSGKASEEAVFSNLSRVFDGEFTGADLKSVFGNLRVDMTRATLPAAGARLRLSAVFGEVEVRVPREWRVDVRGSPTGGSIKNDAISGSGPTLTVECESVFGNVEIRN